MSSEFGVALSEMDDLIHTVKCVMLGSVSSRAIPLSSYAPACIDTDYSILIYLSSMAKHASNIRRSGVASAMVIEDESNSENLFARKRLTMDCDAKVLRRDSDPWKEGMEKMESSLGETMGYLKNLVDFDLFRLDPREGRLVLGFGKAYHVSGPGLRTIDFVKAGGHRVK